MYYATLLWQRTKDNVTTNKPFESAQRKKRAKARHKYTEKSAIKTHFLLHFCFDTGFLYGYVYITNGYISGVYNIKKDKENCEREKFFRC